MFNKKFIIITSFCALITQPNCWGATHPRQPNKRSITEELKSLLETFTSYRNHLNWIPVTDDICDQKSPSALPTDIQKPTNPNAKECSHKSCSNPCKFNPQTPVDTHKLNQKFIAAILADDQPIID